MFFSNYEEEGRKGGKGERKKKRKQREMKWGKEKREIIEHVRKEGEH